MQSYQAAFALFVRLERLEQGAVTMPRLVRR
jgi:hypothetical protein